MVAEAWEMLGVFERVRVRVCVRVGVRASL